MKYLFVVLVLFFAFLDAKEIAFAKSVTGQVTVKDSGKVVKVKQGDWLNENMVVSTKENSEIKLIFKDDSFVVLGSNSILVLQKYVFEPKNKKFDFQLNLNKGVASFESGKIGKLSPESFVFRTPESTVAIRGTKFIVKVQ